MIFLVFMTILMYASKSSPFQTAAWAAVTNVMVYANLLYFFRGIKRTAALVRIIIAVMYDMNSFLMLLMVIWFGFAVSFLLLGSVNNTEFHDTYFLSIFATFSLGVLGQWELGDFEDFSEPVFAKIMIMFLDGLVFIVMMNILIAFMQDSYSKVQTQTNAEISREQARMVVEFYKFMDKERRDTADKLRWFFVLFPREDMRLGRRRWQGQVSSIKEEIKTNVLALEQSFSHSHIYLRQKLDTMEEKMQFFEHQFKSINQKLTRMLELHDGAPQLVRSSNALPIME